MTEVRNQEGKAAPWNRAIDIASMTPEEQKEVFTELGQMAKIARGKAPVVSSGLGGTALQRRRGAIIRRGR